MKTICPRCHMALTEVYPSVYVCSNEHVWEGSTCLVGVMGLAGYLAVALLDATGARTPITLRDETMATTNTKMSAPVYVVAMEIFCPCCDRSDPIPAPDGSFMWDKRPDIVTCPDCKARSRTAKRYQ